MKKFLSVATAAVLSVAMLAGCGGSKDDTTTATEKPADTTTATEAPADNTDNSTAEDTGTTEKKDVALKVWANQEDQTLVQEMVDAFKDAHPENNWTITLGMVAEPDAKAKYQEDPSAAADVFHFANDQIRDLVLSGSLYEVTRNKVDIVTRNSGGSIESSTVNGALYAYPFSSDNGYFMYYDKSVFSEEDVKSFEKMLEVADAAGKKVLMDVSNGWYNVSFFLGAGGTLSIGADGKQVCDFNNYPGVGESMKNITASNAFLTGDDTVIVGGMGDTIAAAVSGTWNATAIQEKLGDNYAATKLPTFDVDGTPTQMSSFAGFKLIGVNSLSAFPAEAMDLADWLSNEENQLKRFYARQIGPSNLNAAANPDVLANVALSALAEQGEFAKSQNDVLGNFWTPAEAFGQAMENKDYSKSVQELLDDMVAQIQA